jgi:NAD(P) transhydrogenase subunit alpha
MNKILPMMSTAAGTLLAGKVFVIGAGVAGLQAIATARRLGARVEAFDTRPVVAEQVRSLGAKFVEIDLGGETGQTEQGYARELTPEQLARQREGMKACCAAADLVITTAQVFGRPAPRIVTHDMVAAMRPGSVIVDMAVESGGNVDGSVAGRTEDIGGVLVVGETNLPGRVAQHASQVYAMNLFSLVEEFWDKESKTLRLDPSDDILASCLLTHAGEVRDERFRLT